MKLDRSPRRPVRWIAASAARRSCPLGSPMSKRAHDAAHQLRERLPACYTLGISGGGSDLRAPSSSSPLSSKEADPGADGEHNMNKDGEMANSTQIRH